MGRLETILGVQSRQEFFFRKNRYRVCAGALDRWDDLRKDWKCDVGADILPEMISHPDEVAPLPPWRPFSAETIQMLEALLVIWPGCNWIGREADGTLRLYHRRPGAKSLTHTPNNFAVLLPRVELYEIVNETSPIYIPDHVQIDEKGGR